MRAIARVLFLLGCCMVASANDGAARPNILLIVADDLGFSDLGCYGGEIETPHLDRLAAEGMRFTQFYNCAVCNASRVAALTGLYPRFGKSTLWRDGMMTAAEVLRDAGYRTAMSGKWHLGGAPTRPIDRGFQEYCGVMIGAVNYFDPTLPDPPPMKHAGPPQPFVHNDKPVPNVPADYYVTDAFTDHAVQQIQASATSKKPFFLHLAYTAPHYPLQARAEDIAKYRGRYKEGYTVLRQRRHQRLIELGLIAKDSVLATPDKKTSGWRYDVEPEAWESVDQGWEAAKMEVYAAMVDRMDQGIGRLLAALKENGVEDNTLVIFFSDNGGCGSNSSAAAHEAYQAGKPVGDKDSYILGGPGWATVQSSPFRRYKTWTYEGGITTPMIVRWPGKVKQGSIAKYVTHLIDLMPTFLEVTGTRFPAEFAGHNTLPLEGKSLLPILLGDGVTAPRELGWQLYGSRAYRQGRWKIVWGVSTKRWELYDMETDRTETHDLATERPGMVTKLSAVWQAWEKHTALP
ncbi:MAG: arylsulfatase [Prosthecobacter sp.]